MNGTYKPGMGLFASRLSMLPDSLWLWASKEADGGATLASMIERLEAALAIARELECDTANDAGRPSIFAAIDGPALQAATMRIGFDLIGQGIKGATDMASDDTISPEMLGAALLRAHIGGLCSAFPQAAWLLKLGTPDQAVEKVVAELRAELRNASRIMAQHKSGATHGKD